MTRRYFKDMDDFAESDVVIVGAGSAGLACAYELGKVAPHLKVGWLASSTCTATTFLLSVPAPSFIVPQLINKWSNFCAQGD